jgi:RimJ/RimL family protein N-acetyltransferase
MPRPLIEENHAVRILLFLGWLLDRRRQAFAGERLTFRWMRRDDIPSLCARMTPACVAAMSPSGDDLRNPTMFRRTMDYGIIVERNGEVVGDVTLTLADGSFGLWIAPEHRRRGYGSEAIRTLLAHPWYGRGIRQAGCYDDNVACRKIIEGNGFVEERRQPIVSPLCLGPRTGVFFRRPRAGRRHTQPPRELAEQSATGD